VAPSAVLNVPAGHSICVVASGEQYEPAGHRVSFREPVGQKLPGEHGAHVAFEVAPSAALNVPAGQIVGVAAPSEQCDPAAHC